MARGDTVRPKILEYLEKHSDETIYLDTIAKDLNLEPIQVKRGISALAYGNVNGAKEKLQTIVAGNVWIWHSRTSNPKSKSISKLYEQVYTGKDGSILVESEEGTLYKLFEI